MSAYHEFKWKDDFSRIMFNTGSKKGIDVFRVGRFSWTLREI